MTVDDLDHVVIHVGDWEAAHAFYLGVLGMDRVENPEATGNPLDACAYRLGERQVNVHGPWPGQDGRCCPPPLNEVGRADLAFRTEWEQTIVDALDPGALGNWWRRALGWIVVSHDPDEFEIRPAADRLPGLLFVRVPEQKTSKNRLHLDFRPDDRDAEVERLCGLGATRADVGQGEQSWIVLADPEGNEFCVLGSRAP